MAQLNQGGLPGRGDNPLRWYLEAREFAGRRPAAGGEGEYDALAACRELSDALDRSLIRIFEAAAPADVAVIAVGGYGRREQSRHSDIDLMLLVRGSRATAEATELLYPLWDSDLKVGHSVRTVEQAIEAAENVETLTALIDARLVAGYEDMFERFSGRLAGLVKRRRLWLLRELRVRREALVASEPWQLQEPDVKNGRGGLRSIQAVHWLDRAETLTSDQEQMPDDPAVDEAKETLFATRNALHAVGDRLNDRYLRDLAPRVTDWLGESRLDWERKLFGAMRFLDALESSRLRRAESDDRVSGLGRFFGPFGRRWKSRVRQRSREDNSPDLDRLLALLEQAGPEPLEPLPTSDWLSRLLPEWESLRCLPHSASFHRHPVDVHAWRTVEEALFAMSQDVDDTGSVAAADEFGSRRTILLAALLHDIGKGHEGEHSEVGAVIAERFATRAGIAPEEGWRLALAVRHHLLLPNVGTRRDIADAKVLNEVADAVRDTSMLHLLYVLSIADSRASGPDVWSPWKAQLIKTLYRRVLNMLTSGEAEVETVAVLRARVEELLARRFDMKQVRDHLDQLPISYLLGNSAETIGEHMQLIEDAAGSTAILRTLSGQVECLTVVTPDRPGILSLVSGTLAVHNVNVLGGMAFTRDDGVAIEIMHVDDALGHGIDERRWGRVAEAVPEALAGRLPVETRLAETRAAYKAAPRLQMDTTVHIDNVASEDFSIVEVNTADRLGLLFEITNTLRELSLDIHVAKVDTIGPEVVDAFYVQDRNGRRVEAAEEIEFITRSVRDAVNALDATQS